MINDFDIAVVGSGFAGSLLSMIARRTGHSVVMIERGRHPRFVIGESSTPLADQLWAGLVGRYGLTALAPFSQHGTWRRVHPEIACGLKRGFTFCHHRWHEPYRVGPERDELMLVAASTDDDRADTHWYRPDLDAFLAGEAQRLGVEYLDETLLDAVEFTPAGVRLGGRRGKRAVAVRAGLVVDASGPRGFLHGALGLGERALPHLPATQALYTHFTDAGLFADGGLPGEAGVVGEPPYPPDDAALHHVFEGGWVWVLRFHHGLTSAGVVARETVGEGLRLAEGQRGWERLLAALPGVGRHLGEARAARPFVHVPRLPFWCSRASGPRWMLLPYAAGFLDPLLSTGFPLSLLGIGRLSAWFEKPPPDSGWEGVLARCAAEAEADLLAAEQLIAALYAVMGDPLNFNALLQLYFAAASSSEVGLREGRPVEGFLLRQHPHFGPASRACCGLALSGAARSPAGRGRLRQAVAGAIAPVNLMRLGDPELRNWYPLPGQNTSTESQ